MTSRTGLPVVHGARPDPRGARGFWPMRDLPVVGWLLATVVLAFVHPFVPAPRWLLIHLTLLGAATHAILVWSRHFADALLHLPTGPHDRRDQNRRLVLLALGVLTVVAGVVSSVWPVTVAGAVGVVAAVGWHGVTLWRQQRSALGSRFAGVIRFYVAAAALLPVGVVLGVLLARGPADPWHQRLVVAHASVNVLGWIGLTVLGTLVTLWPTMLRTRVADGAEGAAARALPVLLGAVLLAAGGALVDLLPLTTLGMAAYLAGVALLARPFVVVARHRPPATFATRSALAAVLWLMGCLVAVVAGFVAADDWAAAGDWFGRWTPYLAAGFGAQVLLGALSFLVPMALGGGPGPVMASSAVLDRAGALRVTVANAGLVACALPVPAAVRVLCSVAVLVALASFLPLLVLAIRTSRRVRGQRGLPPLPDPARPGWRGRRGVVTGVAVVVLAAAAGVAVDLGALADRAPASAGVAPTGETTVVRVEARDMRFHPATVEVPAGNELVIELTNTDTEDVHDLVLDSGHETPRLAPRESATLEVGVVGRDLAGWCSVIGHHQMGMAFTVRVTGTGGTGGDDDGVAGGNGVGEVHADHGHDSPLAGDGHGGHAAPAQVPPGPAAAARDAVLPPLRSGRVHRRTLRIRDVVHEVSPGVTQRLWTFDGSAPGPTLHGRVGDRFVVTLVNEGSVGHSIDFHAGERAPDRVMRTIPPGGRLVYRFTATRAGVWMYHCSTMPMAAHVANGLFGAVVIEPRGLAPVDRSYLLVQSELYLGPDAGEVDLEKLAAERPDLVVFNGAADQYAHDPLPARVDERVRIWVLDAGPNRSTSFHVVGEQFDTTYAEGAFLLRPGEDGGAQSLALAPAQGGFVELAFDEPGNYPFVSHVMVDAERGARGAFRVR